MNIVYVLAYEKDISDEYDPGHKEWVPYAVFKNIHDCERMKRPGDKSYEVPFFEDSEEELIIRKRAEDKLQNMDIDPRIWTPHWMAEGTTAEPPPKDMRIMC